MRRHESRIIKEMTRPQSNRSLLARTLKAPERREKSPIDRNGEKKLRKSQPKLPDRPMSTKNGVTVVPGGSKPRPIKTYAPTDKTGKLPTPRKEDLKGASKKISTLGQVKEGFAKYLKADPGPKYAALASSRQGRNDQRLAPSASQANLDKKDRPVRESLVERDHYFENLRATLDTVRESINSNLGRKLEFPTRREASALRESASSS